MVVNDLLLFPKSTPAVGCHISRSIFLKVYTLRIGMHTNIMSPNNWSRQYHKETCKQL